MSNKRKPFEVIVATMDGGRMKIEHVKECTSQKMTEHGSIQELGALYVVTGEETFIFPFNNLIYARLAKEVESKENVDAADQEKVV